MDEQVAKVFGGARYTSDLDLPRMLHAVLVRSQVSHGRLLSIDSTEAAASPGVVKVVTAEDFGDIDPFYGELINDQPMLAIDTIRYAGEPVCAIVAQTRAQAYEAARLVDVEIEPLPPLLTPAAAMSTAADAIHADLSSDSADFPNVCREDRLVVGDVESALADAAYVHHAVYTCPAVYHYAMEPHCSIASWEDGRLNVISGTQQPFRVRDCLARMFSLSISKVSVRAPFVGGAYGSKGETKYEPVVALMARCVGRPVKLLLNVEEAVHTVTRHGCSVEMWTALDEKGTITGRKSVVNFDTGAYADKGPRIAKRGALRVSGPYRIPNIAATSRAVYTNNVPAGAFRGFSTSQVLWASESAMDEIAVLLGEDPVSFRARHVIGAEDLYAGVDEPVDANLQDSLAAAAASLGDVDDSAPAHVGRAIALGVKDGGGGAAHASAVIRLHPDGSLEVIAGATELGQGAYGVLAEIAAHALSVPVERVHVRLADTDDAPFDRGTNASRTTVGVGLAVEDAATRLLDELKSAWLASKRVPAELRLDGDHVVADGERVQLGTLISEATRLPRREFPGLSHVGHHIAVPPGNAAFPTLYYEIGSTAVELEVDVDTGQIHLRKLVSLIETGKALSVAACHGQNVGAAVMGIGTTLTEQIVAYDGEVQNANLIEYRVPTVASLPRFGLESVLVENGDGPGPQGAKGVGEAGIIAVAPAIANALQAAVGVRVRDLPLHPEAVWRALREPTPPVWERSPSQEVPGCTSAHST
jgi:CO/xanthine dehydrogenase Mo-binding subunit